MYDWITHTWNPLAGDCGHKCTYCSTQKLKHRFPELLSKYSGDPREDKTSICDNLGKLKKIFVCAQNDLFEDMVPFDIIKRILTQCFSYNDNMYVFQTKNPKNMFEVYEKYPFPQNSIFGTTIETDDNNLLHEYSAVTDEENPFLSRLTYMDKLKSNKKTIFITIEPIMKFDDIEYFIKCMRELKPNFINIGADSGNNNLPEPTKEEIKYLISQLESTIKIYIKNNLNRINN